MCGQFLRRSVVILALCLVGCQTTNTPTPGMYDLVPTVVEPGLAYGQPCSPPCWQGLTPGKSTSADVARAIDQVEVSGWAKSVVQFPSGGFLAQPIMGSYAGAVTAAVDEGVVTYISGNPLFYYSLLSFG